MPSEESQKVAIVLNFGQRKRYILKRRNVKDKIRKRLNLPDTNFQLQHLSWKAKQWEDVEEEDLVDRDEIRVKGYKMTNVDDADSDCDVEPSLCANLRKKLKKCNNFSESDKRFLSQVLWYIEPKRGEVMKKKDESAIAEVSDKSTQTSKDLQENEFENKDKCNIETEACNDDSSLISEETDKCDDVEMSEIESNSQNSTLTLVRPKISEKVNQVSKEGKQKYQDSVAKKSDDESRESGIEKKKKNRSSRNSNRAAEEQKQDLQDSAAVSGDDESIGSHSQKMSRSSRNSNRAAEDKEKQDLQDSAAVSDDESIGSHMQKRSRSSRNSNRAAKEKKQQDLQDSAVSDDESIGSHIQKRERRSRSSRNLNRAAKEEKQQDLQDSFESDDESRESGSEKRKKRKSKSSPGRSAKKSRTSTKDSSRRLSHSTILNKMKTELKKATPNSDIISQLMDASFKSRQDYILINNPPVKDILKTYPALKMSEQVIKEYGRIREDLNFDRFEKNLDKYSEAVLKNLPPSSMFSTSHHETKFVNMVLMDEGTTEMKRAMALLLLPAYFNEDATNFISFKVTRNNVYPMITCNKEVDDMFKDDSDFTLQVENTMLCTAACLEEAFYAYMASYYIFSIEFPPSLMNTISLVESLFLGVEPETVLEKVEEVKKMILSKV